MKTITISDLAQTVSQELSTPEPQARAVLDRAIETVRKELQRGNRIELRSLVSFSVRQGSPVTTKSDADASLQLPASRIVQIDLDEDLRQKIEGTGQFQILLVVPHKNFFTGVLAARVRSPRSEVTVVEGEDEAINFMRKSLPDLVVLDVGLKHASRVCEAIKFQKEHSMTAVIRIFAESEDPKAIRGLEVPNDEYIVEPFELTDLVKITESELSRFAEQRNYFDHEVHFKLQSADAFVERANEMIGNCLAQSGMSEEAAAALGVAFREAIDNAHRHGNKSNPEHLIDVLYLLDREKATIAVTDEGDGFDTEVYLSRGVSGNPVAAARERNLEGRAGGLGIMLMLKCVDKLEYNYAGNKIVLTKYIRKN